MKTKSSQVVLFIAMISIGMTMGALAQSQSVSQETQGVQLFNGKDLSNWEFCLRDTTVDPSNVFTVQNGVIHITGNPFGYMRTKEIYSNYKLHLEWRWPKEATNSGVFIHAQLPDRIWIKSIECQLQAGNAGDLACIGGIDMKEVIDKTRRVGRVKKMAESSEKPVSEWNIMEVICDGNTIEVSVNGVLQNKGSELTVTQGHIGLQSEGKDIEFRKLTLNKL